MCDRLTKEPRIIDRFFHTQYEELKGTNKKGVEKIEASILAGNQEDKSMHKIVQNRFKNLDEIKEKYNKTLTHEK